MFNRIVVPLDGTRFAEVALAPARELARAYNSRILLVRAISPSGLPRTAVTPEQQAGLNTMDDADAYLHRIVGNLRTAGYDAEMVLYVAEPGTGIARTAELDHADVIVMSTHLRWKIEPTAGTSTTLSVLAHCGVPILAWRVSAALERNGGPDVGERPPILARTEYPIVVPLDGSPFAESALVQAESLARTFGSYLVLVRAVDRAAAPSPQAAMEEAQAYLKRVQQEVEHRGVHTTTVARVGTPLGVIDTTWREYDATLIVMASHGQTGVMGSFLGSVAARIIEEVEAPVLVIRPQVKPEPQGPADVISATTNQ